MHTNVYGSPCIYIKSTAARADLEEMVWRAVMTMRGISTERNTAITTISIIVVLCASRCRRVSRLPLHKQRCQRNVAFNIHNPSPSPFSMKIFVNMYPNCKSPYAPSLNIAEIIAKLR